MTQPEIEKSSESSLTTDRINNMAFAFWQSGILIAAIEFDLFTAIFEGHYTPAGIAERIKAPEDSVERLLLACAYLKLIERRDGKYFNAPDVDKFLVKGKPSYNGDYFAIQAKADFNGWNDIANGFRQSVPAEKKSKKGYHFDNSQCARDYAASLFNLGFEGAQKFATQFDFSRYSLFLDLGGGAGTFSIAAAQEHPHLKAIVFDYPNVVAVAEDFINKSGVSDRVKTISGNFFDTEYPSSVDLAAYIACLQVYGPEDVQFLVNKAFNAIEPGGGFIIMDYMLNKDKTGPSDSLIRHLQQRGIFHENPGYINTEAEFREYLKKAGFIDIVVIDIQDSPMGFVFGRKSK